MSMRLVVIAATLATALLSGCVSATGPAHDCGGGQTAGSETRC
jgi:hypothetical protein